MLAKGIGKLRAVKYKMHAGARGFDEDEQEYPDEVRWIKTGQKSRRLLPEELVTPDEVMTLVGVAETPRDRAFKSHRSHQNVNRSHLDVVGFHEESRACAFEA